MSKVQDRRRIRAAILAAMSEGKHDYVSIGNKLLADGHEPTLQRLHEGRLPHIGIRYLDNIVSGSISALLRHGYIRRVWVCRRPACRCISPDETIYEPGLCGWRITLLQKGRQFLTTSMQTAALLAFLLLTAPAFADDWTLRTGRFREVLEATGPISIGTMFVSDNPRRCRYYVVEKVRKKRVTGVTFDYDPGCQVPRCYMPHNTIRCEWRFRGRRKP